MSNTNYPTSVDTIYDPSTSDTLASANHHLIHGQVNDAVTAIETKLGTGTTLQTSSTGSFLVGTGTGASQWQTSPTSPSFTTSLLDTNNKTWIGQTAVTNAVNYINISNNSTTNSPSISALGSDSNINLNLVPKGSGAVQDNGTNLIDFRSSFANFIKTGGIWSIQSGLAGNMTAITMFINGVEYSVAAITGHTFAASKDTYVDYTVGTGITYTAVNNSATAPALAGNSIRIGKIVTGASAITYIAQNTPNNTYNYYGGDGIGNIIYPTGPATTSMPSNPCMFSVYLGANVAANSGGVKIVPFDTKDFDVGNNVDISVNKGRFTATIPGYYQFNSWVAYATAASSRSIVSIYKNGAEYKRGLDATYNGASYSGGGVSGVIAVGTSDYIEIGFFSGSSSNNISTNDASSFNGYLVSPM